MLNMNFKEEWKRPFTAKRYLHGPFAQYMYTMWADMKVMCGPIDMLPCGYRSSAVKLLMGEKLEAVSFYDVKTVPREDGIPVHLNTYKNEDVSITMEACCNVGVKVPAAFVKITLENISHKRISDRLALLMRTGREDHLVGMEVDGYCHFDDNVHNYGFLESKWKYDEGCANAGKCCASNIKCRVYDGEYEIGIKTEDFEPVWQDDEPGLLWYQKRILILPFEIDAGEKKELYFTFRPQSDTALDFDFDEIKAATTEFWKGELAKLHTIPDSDEHRDVVNNLVAQCLQMFAIPRGEDYIYPRQGGLQRLFWPSEAYEFLIMLDDMGDYGSYTEPVYDTYFGPYTTKEGEDDGKVSGSNSWAAHTASAIWSCAHYIVAKKSKAAYERYADKLYRSFQWIQRMRAKSYESDCVGKGIFPAMKSSDWPGEYQSWCITDTTNLMGVEMLAQAFEMFDDPRANEVRDAYNDYMKCMKDILKVEVEKAKAKRPGQDGILLNNKLGLELDYLPFGPYFDDGPANLLRAGVIEADSEEAHLIENFLRSCGCMSHGLTGLMNDGLIFQGHNADPWAGHTWYVSTTDLMWSLTWLKQGEIEKAKETIEAQMFYGMTEAYYMMERYADNDPYWVPWMPNASANGRMLQMLFALYGSRKIK